MGVPSRMGMFYAFTTEENRDVVDRINREVPEEWPANEADLGFVCPLPSQLNLTMRD
jgi:hypothetical protein